MFSSPIALWFVVGVIALAAEVATAALISIWFSIGSLFAVIAAVAGAPFWMQAALFFFISALCFIVFHHFWKESLKKNFTPTNADRVIGESAVVTEEINNLGSTGAVRVLGQEWTARTKENSEIIPKDAIVKILQIEGSKVYVALDTTPGEHSPKL